jgi:ribosomal protein S18 acetylase RimI-like enzyme
MPLPFARATEADAAEIAALRSAAARELTALHGRGHWSFEVTDRSVAFGIRTSYVLAALDDGRIVGTLRLSTKKPWAIDRACFSEASHPLYLTDMAVDPARQRQGIGRQLLDEAKTIARQWPADAIRLDAYDAAAGAGLFYAKCGFAEVSRRTYRGVPLIYFELRVTE